MTFLPNLTVFEILPLSVHNFREKTSSEVSNH